MSEWHGDMSERKRKRRELLRELQKRLRTPGEKSGSDYFRFQVGFTNLKLETRTIFEAWMIASKVQMYFVSALGRA